jgi:hypothetical protein
MKPAIITALLSFLLATTSFSQFIRYVSASGSGAGSSWADASGNLQSMIDASTDGDQVWVRGGTLTPGATRASAFSMKNGVAIYGSFAGNETLLSQRVLTNGLTTVLSSEIGAPGSSDNCYHTISNSGLDSTALIDGFVIRDANDDRTITYTEGLGGGIYNDGSTFGNTCSPTIQNCVIINNRASFGAGIFNSGYNLGVSTPHILNCVIASNSATIGGGGIDNFGVNGNASPTITNCVIYNNSATQRAGGMYCWGGSNGNATPVVLNTVFANNSASEGGGVICDNLNDGIPGSSGSANPAFRNCIFWGNTAVAGGPQFFVLGTGTFIATYSDVDLTGQSSPHIISGSGSGNFSDDPVFTNLALGEGADGNWKTTDDGLTPLSQFSPIYNAGDNAGVTATDILNNSRILFGTVDMGPYESTMPPLSFSSSQTEEVNIQVGPNPAEEEISIQISPEVLGTSFYIFNVSGIPVSAGIFTGLSTRLDVKSFSPGVYFLVTSGEKGKALRFVKE